MYALIYQSSEEEDSCTKRKHTNWKMLTVLIHHTHKVVLNVYLIMKLIEHKLCFFKVINANKLSVCFSDEDDVSRQSEQDEKQKGEWRSLVSKPHERDCEQEKNKYNINEKWKD